MQELQNILDKVWPEWKVRQQIGVGSYGTVYSIDREDMGHLYKSALKVITIPQSQEDFEKTVERLKDRTAVINHYKAIVEKISSEVVLMSRLKGISNIVSYEDHTVIEDESGIGWNILIRMELLTPLYSYLADNEITVKDTVQIGIDMCKALEACKHYGIIHCDIKPENIFISDLGHFKLGDFGISNTIESANETTRRGSMTYIAPEVYFGKDFDERADIYSLGIVLYRFLNNNMIPFGVDRTNTQTNTPINTEITENIQEEYKEALKRRLVSKETLPEPRNTDHELAQLILKACSYEAKDRFANATEMKNALVKYLKVQEPKKSKKSWMIGGIICLLVLGLLAGTGLGGRKKSGSDGTETSEIKEEQVYKQWDEIKERGTIKVGTTTDTPYKTEIINETCHKMGLEPEIVMIEMFERESALKNGKIDCLLEGAYDTDQVEFCDKFINMNMSIYVAPENKEWLEGSFDEVKEKLAGHTFALSRGTKARRAFDSVADWKSSDVLVIETYHAAFRSVKKGKADIAIAPTYMDYNPKKLYRKDFGELSYSVTYGFLPNSDLTDHFSDAQKALEKDGTLKKIYKELTK